MKKILFILAFYMSRLLLKHKLCCKVQQKTQYISVFLVCFYFARHKSPNTLKDAENSRD